MVRNFIQNTKRVILQDIGGGGIASKPHHQQQATAAATDPSPDTAAARPIIGGETDTDTTDDGVFGDYILSNRKNIATMAKFQYNVNMFLLDFFVKNSGAVMRKTGRLDSRELEIANFLTQIKQSKC